MMDLLPPEALEQVANVLTFGAKKYDRGNWSKGIVYSRILSATLRHITKFMAGEDIDPESGLSHIAHACCNMMFLLHFIRYGKDLDDRWIKERQ